MHLQCSLVSFCFLSVGRVRRASDGSRITIRSRTSGLWMIFTSVSSVLRCAVDTDGVTTVTAGQSSSLTVAQKGRNYIFKLLIMYFSFLFFLLKHQKILETIMWWRSRMLLYFNMRYFVWLNIIMCSRHFINNIQSLKTNLNIECSSIFLFVGFFFCLDNNSKQSNSNPFSSSSHSSTR